MNFYLSFLNKIALKIVANNIKCGVTVRPLSSKTLYFCLFYYYYYYLFISFFVCKGCNKFSYLFINLLLCAVY